MEIPSLARVSQDHNRDTRCDLTERLLTIGDTGCEYADQCAFGSVQSTQLLDRSMKDRKGVSACDSETRIKINNVFHLGSDPG